MRDECDSDDVGSDVILARDMAACIPETSSLCKCTQLLDRQICKCVQTHANLRQYAHRLGTAFGRCRSSLYLHCKRELVKELDSLGCAISCDRPMPTPVPSLPAAQRVFYGMEVVLERWGIDPESEERMFLSACEVCTKRVDSLGCGGRRWCVRRSAADARPWVCCRNRFQTIAPTGWRLWR